MCKECGCEDEEHVSEEKVIEMDRSLMEKNDIIAHEIVHNLKDKGILCVNVMGAPGSGKTTFIEGVANYIDVSKIAVIQGDLESEIDKKRLEQIKIETTQINTHSGCHLNAAMVSKAMLDLSLRGKNYLFIENVGNLVCPAGVKIGQHMDLVVSSTTEGSDKPKKYPIIFMDAKLIVISKQDIAGAVGFDEETYVRDLRGINNKARVIKVSSKDVESFKEAAQFLKHHREHVLGHEHSH